MKNNLFSIVIATLVLFGAGGCSKDANEDANTPKVTVDFRRVSTMQLEATITPNEAVSQYHAVVVSKELYAEFVEIYGDGDKITFLKNLAGKGLAIVGTKQATDIHLLNGATGYEYIFVILLFDKNGDACEPLIETPFSAPPFVEGLAQASVAISVSDIAPLSARIKITPDKNTLGYYVGVVPTAYYEALATPEDLDDLRLDFAGIGGLFFEAFNGSCTLSEDCADYTVAVFPFNANGADGYGPIVTSNFSTTSATTNATIYRSGATFTLAGSGRYTKALTQLP